MSMELTGPIMADVGGLSLNAEDRELLCHPLVGGVILFARNYQDPEQLRVLCRDVLALPRRCRVLLAVDHEGGRIQRFRDGFTAVPPMRTLGLRHEHDPHGAEQEARAHGRTIGRELAAFGIDLCFAPVLDVDHGVSRVIGDRAFAANPQAVATLARAFCDGLASEGLAATGKHFPGHGAVEADSHFALPVDERPMAEIERIDVAPFRTLIADGIESLMMAHVRYTAFDATPASLSRRWIRGYLRRRIGFRGAVFCDDLSMHGAAVVGSMSDRARLALEAGCDMLPVCNDRSALIALLDGLRGLKISPTSSRRLRRLFRASSPPRRKVA